MITVADTEDAVVVPRTTGSFAVQFYVDGCGDFRVFELSQFPLHEVEDLLVGLEGVCCIRRLQLIRVGAQVEEAIAIFGAFDRRISPVGLLNQGAGVTVPSSTGTGTSQALSLKFLLYLNFLFPFLPQALSLSFFSI